jgi:hypothetical protein
MVSFTRQNIQVKRVHVNSIQKNLPVQKWICQSSIMSYLFSFATYCGSNNWKYQKYYKLCSVHILESYML